MKLFILPTNPFIKFLTSLRNAIFLLGVIALLSSLGSVIEQDETISFYQQNYPTSAPIYGFIDFQLILQFGLDHIYTTWWFLSLLLLLSLSLISCTLSRQFPLFSVSKDFLFQKKTTSFSPLPFFIRFQNIPYLKESLLLKIQQLDFYVYQKKNILYGYKGLVGRISPILVHFSLLIILFGSSFSAFVNFKAQEVIPKGEVFHIQNPIKIGLFTQLPNISTRVNDFWVEYDNNKRIHQFYSHLSLLDNKGREVKQQTISVNNPLRYKNIDFYQSDWNIVGLRMFSKQESQIIEFPMFTVQQGSKSWITWIVPKSYSKNISNKIKKEEENSSFTLLINQFQNTILIYNQEGTFIATKSIGEWLTPDLQILEIIPSTGLLMKYDPTITIIYLGFGILMITALLSYLPYTQIWMVQKENYSFLGSSTNRGKIQLEIDFENLLRGLEKK